MGQYWQGGQERNVQNCDESGVFGTKLTSLRTSSLQPNYTNVQCKNFRHGAVPATAAKISGIVQALNCACGYMRRRASNTRLPNLWIVDLENA
jgi:hypothetical protein